MFCNNRILGAGFTGFALMTAVILCMLIYPLQRFCTCDGSDAYLPELDLADLDVGADALFVLVNSAKKQYHEGGIGDHVATSASSDYQISRLSCMARRVLSLSLALLQFSVPAFGSLWIWIVVIGPAWTSETFRYSRALSTVNELYAIQRREKIHGASPQGATHRGNTSSCLTSSVDEVLKHDGLAQFKDCSNVILES
ncbi:hypothetical protein AcV7_008489 [Taiwanofungus camphoratus]|nr:hypothetical protein AcV7_008489 [Antrodia cinnamomea]